MPAVPRQRKFRADLAVINECLNELIELVGAAAAAGAVAAGPAAAAAQLLLPPTIYLPQLPSQQWEEMPGRTLKPPSPQPHVTLLLQAKKTRQADDIEALQARDYSKVRRLWCSTKCLRACKHACVPCCL